MLICNIHFYYFYTFKCAVDPYVIFSLTSEEYLQTVRNLPEILDLHSCFVRLLEECYERPSLEQRVGNIFLSMVYFYVQLS